MIERNFNLKPFNTFGIDCFAAKFGTFKNVEELKRLLSAKDKDEETFILGGGSNILLTKDFNGLVLKNEILGTEITQENDSEIILKVGAGTIWHEFVLSCIDSNYCGVENLSLIPGSVGASPMQNIGAYGVEIKDIFHSLEAFHIESEEIHTFDNNACEFGYRESVFKRKFKNQYIILNVSYRLAKQPELKTSYGAIKTELLKHGINTPSIKDISDAVISIRQSKLPDPKILGNAGSFFKNPVVDNQIVKEIQINSPEIPAYPTVEGKSKLAAGWLIEKAGWKGIQIGQCGVHKNQALVLVNYGGAHGSQILDLSQKIINDVEVKFGITLEREVNIM